MPMRLRSWGIKLGCTFLFAGALATTGLAADRSTSATLEFRIAAIAEKPAIERNPCLFLSDKPTIPVMGFSRATLMIGPAQFQELRARREEAVAILRRDISKADSKALAEHPASLAYESRLLMLLDLNASEAIEDLIAAAGRLGIPETPQAPKKNHFMKSVVTGDCPDLATLSAILALLYREGDPATLRSEFAEAWRKNLQGRNSISEGGFKNLPEGAQAYMFDPLEKRAVPVEQYAIVESTPERQEAILALARDFVKRVPPGERARAKDMLPDPYPR